MIKGIAKMKQETDLVKLTEEIRRAQAEIDSMTSRRQRILAKQQARDVLNSDTDNDGYDTPSSDSAADEAQALKVIEQYRLDPNMSKADKKLLKGAVKDSKKREHEEKKKAKQLAAVDKRVIDSDEEDEILMANLVFTQKMAKANKEEEKKD